MMYKRKVRENQSKEEKEFRKIEHVIQMRNHRATRIEENIEIEKIEKMMKMKCGRIIVKKMKSKRKCLKL